MAKLITINDSEYMEQLMMMANGNLDLIKEAFSASAEGPKGGADLKAVIQYIVTHQAPPEPKVH